MNSEGASINYVSQNGGKKYGEKKMLCGLPPTRIIPHTSLKDAFLGKKELQTLMIWS